MTTDYIYELDELNAYQARLSDEDHRAGCPAKRVEVEVVQGPSEEVDVETGRARPDGRKFTRPEVIPGPYFVKVRCLDCAEERVIPITDSTELSMRVGSGAGG